MYSFHILQHNLGVFEEDPGTLKGTIRIMKHLNQYVPVKLNGKPFPILTNGDQKSHELMVSGRIAMASSENENDRFMGLIPIPQEFHKRGIVLQV